MPVTENQSDLFRDYQAEEAPVEALLSKGRVYVASGTVAALATDLATSTYKLCEVPADALPHPDTYFDVENWNFTNVRIGTLDDPDALVAQTQATEDIVAPIAQGGADFGKRWWQLLGLAENPGGRITLYAHANENASGAGQMQFAVHSIWN